MLKKIFIFLLPFIYSHAIAGFNDIETVRSKTIKTVKLFPIGNQTAYAIIRLGAIEQLELHFDDISDYTKTLNYTYQLCDANWDVVDMSEFDFIKGFSQGRITIYRPSSVSLTRYVHYTINLPEKNCMPSRSGNYLLKVFENGDTSNLLFTKKILVLNNKTNISIQMIQPFANSGFKSNQRLVVNVNTSSLNEFTTNQQLKVVVLQNNRWDNAQMASNPTFIHDKTLEYNSEGLFEFEGEKEWLWLDLRSFRLLSDRVRRESSTDFGTTLNVFADTARSNFRYQYYRDFNGAYFVEMTEDYNLWWQSDYAHVHFVFLPPAHEAFQDKQLYLMGELTGFKTNENNRMVFNPERGFYEQTLLLKNGYYNYSYATVDNTKDAPSTSQYTEGSSWETENQYTVLLYFKGFGARADELVGVANINTIAGLLK